MRHFISMFIDNELDLEDKIEFVHRVHEEEDFYDESLSFLEQEKLILSDPVEVFPNVQFEKAKKWLPGISLFRPFGLLSLSGAIACLILLFAIFSLEKSYIDKGDTPSTYHRFVLYEPEVNKVEITGSFTDWKAVPLKRIGSSGYWQINLEVSQGEHRYTYILEENKTIVDPTIMAREQDDFGGLNSVLFVEA